MQTTLPRCYSRYNSVDCSDPILTPGNHTAMLTDVLVDSLKVTLLPEISDFIFCLIHAWGFVTLFNIYYYYSFYIKKLYESKVCL